MFKEKVKEARASAGNEMSCCTNEDAKAVENPLPTHTHVQSAERAGAESLSHQVSLLAMSRKKGGNQLAQSTRGYSRQVATT